MGNAVMMIWDFKREGDALFWDYKLGGDVLFRHLQGS